MLRRPRKQMRRPTNKINKTHLICSLANEIVIIAQNTIIDDVCRTSLIMQRRAQHSYARKASTRVARNR